ncbi:ABC transporter substrate-binding protein (plasmid) [Roseomonas sp. CCTCC AB2023176]|uniref:ABC transporter substrate-binding protein n=1 Tax=Roseomonas sp. CCTCC AB2023176 TaxID=3342640 RepID=UPI0035E28CC9
MILARRMLLGSAAGLAAPAVRAYGQAPVIRIGVLNDQSGPTRDGSGPGSVVCAQQALAEFSHPSFSVALVAADHQNRPDVGVSIARRWIDLADVDLILDVPISSVALAVSDVVRARNKVMICSGSGSPDLSGAQCSPNTVQWTFDTYMLSRSTATQVVRLGGTRWFFLTGNYVFGRQLERDASRFVRANGGTVVGRVEYPFPGTSDFSSYLLQARSSRADVICFTVGGDDTINGVKQAHEFRLGPTVRLVALAANANDVAAIGPEVAQGLFLTSAFYWDLNDRTRAFSWRVIDRMPQRQPPNAVQAGCYSGAIHYLKAVAALGPARAKADGAAVVARMKELAVDDDAFGSGTVRPDGRAIFPVHLLQAKPPGEIRQGIDTLRLVATTPEDQAWLPMVEGGCPLIRP